MTAYPPSGSGNSKSSLGMPVSFPHIYNQRVYSSRYLYPAKNVPGATNPVGKHAGAYTPHTDRYIYPVDHTLESNRLINAGSWGNSRYPTGRPFITFVSLGRRLQSAQPPTQSRAYTRKGHVAKAGAYTPPRPHSKYVYLAEHSCAGAYTPQNRR